MNAGVPVESLQGPTMPSQAKARLVVEYTKARRDQEAVANLSKKAAALRQDVAGLNARLKSLPPGSPEAKQLEVKVRDKQSQMQATEMTLVQALGGALNSPAANALRGTSNELEALKGNIAGLEADLAATNKDLEQLKASGQADTPRYAALELRKDLLKGQLHTARAMEAPLANLRRAAIDTIQLQGQLLIAQQEVRLLHDLPATPKEQLASALERLQGLQGRLDTATAVLNGQGAALAQARSAQATGLTALHQQLMPRCEALMAENRSRIEQTTGPALAQATDLGGELQDLADSISSLDASDPGLGGADEGVAASEGAGASAQDD